MPGCLIAAGVGFVLFIVGVIALAVFGLQLTAEQVGEKLADHPAVVEAVGEVQAFEGNLWRSADDPDPDLFYYDITGSKGRALVAVKSESVSAEEEKILFAELILPSGERVVLVEEEEAGAADGELEAEEAETP